MCAWPSASARTKNWGTEILTDADQETQLDILHSYFNDSLNASTGHGHTGSTSDGPKINLTTGVQNVLPLANGGTGQSSLTAFLNLIYPVGSVYANMTVSTNPATLLGFGTWTALGGFIAGYDGTTEFATSLQTGGAKTVTLTAAQSGIAAHSHPVTIYTGGLNAGGIPTGLGNNGAASGTGNTNNSTPADASQAHQNLPPYTVGYVWYRTA